MTQTDSTTQKDLTTKAQAVWQGEGEYKMGVDEEYSKFAVGYCASLEELIQWVGSRKNWTGGIEKYNPEPANLSQVETPPTIDDSWYRGKELSDFS